METVKRLFARMGTPAVLIHCGAARDVRVFFQADRSRVLRQVFSPLGQVPQGEYLCCFSGDVRPEAGDDVTLAQLHYRIGRVEPIIGADGQAVYYRALCRQKGGEEL